MLVDSYSCEDLNPVYIYGLLYCTNEKCEGKLDCCFSTRNLDDSKPLPYESAFPDNE